MSGAVVFEAVSIGPWFRRSQPVPADGYYVSITSTASNPAHLFCWKVQAAGYCEHAMRTGSRHGSGRRPQREPAGGAAAWPAASAGWKRRWSARGERQADDELAAVGPVAHGDLALVCFDDPAGNGKTQ